MIQVNGTIFIVGPKKILIKLANVVELHFLGAFARMDETIWSLAGVTTRGCRDCIWNVSKLDPFPPKEGTGLLWPSTAL